jgi:hypothetical protein
MRRAQTLGTVVRPQVAMASDETPSLGIAIDGEHWTATRSLVDSGPESRVFTVRATADGDTVVTFGDGIHGRRGPSGRRRT